MSEINENKFAYRAKMCNMKYYVNTNKSIHKKYRKLTLDYLKIFGYKVNRDLKRQVMFGSIDICDNIISSILIERNFNTKLFPEMEDVKYKDLK